MKIIYIDILLITNFMVDISFLLLVKKISNSFAKKHRIIIAALIGSLSSVTILLSNTFIPFFLKVFFTLVQIIVCFSTFDFKKILRLSAVYTLISVSYAGLAYVVWKILGKNIIYVKNMTVYFDFDTGNLIALTIIFYAAISLWEKIRNYCFDKNKLYKVKTKINGQEFEIDATSDTGNLLVDCYYGKKIAVIASDRLFADLGLENQNGIIKNKLHIMPCKTISGDGIIFVTSPLKIEISDENSKFYPEVCVGICKANGMKEKCVFNPKILL